MSYINLIDKLTDLDKKRIENYISLFGINRKDFIGLDQWLQNWSHANQNLFKLLGEKLIHEIDYSYEKKPEDIEREIIDSLLIMPMRMDYRDFYFDYVKKAKCFSQQDIHFFNHLMDVRSFVYDKIEFGIKFKKEGTAKTLQIQAGMKPIRALQKIMQYFNDYEWNWDNFEAFRLKHSMILNDKYIRGKLCISIHPLDYMTMSDNASNWTSCMSWADEGCYHVGTIEMMNSNNVLCCYLKKDKEHFYFGGTRLDKLGIEIKPITDQITGEILNAEEMAQQEAEYSWNDKKWRQLVYATKDIIMTGKSYPYYNEEFTKDLLRNVAALAAKNIRWSYAYGPERYKDMIHISSISRMEKNRDWISCGNATKHNIIWDTKGMYNDMLNDSYYSYWCVRNKVPHNKIISVSGKCNCLRCNGTIIWNDDDSHYNERFSNCGNVICPDCLEDFECSICNYTSAVEGFKLISVNGRPIKVCKTCWNKYARICPECGKPMWTESTNMPWTNPDTPYILYDKTIPFDYIGGSKEEERKNICAERLYMCKDCYEKLKEKMTIIKVPYLARKWWNGEKERSTKEIKVFKSEQDNKEAEKFIWSNLEPAPSTVANLFKTGF